MLSDSSLGSFVGGYLAINLANSSLGMINLFPPRHFESLVPGGGHQSFSPPPLLPVSPPRLIFAVNLIIGEGRIPPFLSFRGACDYVASVGL